MPKCDLKVVIDRADRTFRPGEAITGAVEVFINDPTQCNDLLVVLEWRTHGKGNVDRGEVQKISVFRGAWQPGESLAYEFKIQVPKDAIATYRGTYLNVDWYVRAQADVPWAIDPKAESDVLVVPAGPGNTAATGPHVETREPTPASTLGCALVFGLLFAGGGTIGVFVAGAEAIKFDCGGIFGLLISSIFVLVGVAAIWAGFRSAKAESAVGRVVMKLDRSAYRSGDRIALDVTLRPARTLDMKSVTATLEAFEKCVSGSGSNKTTHTHSLCNRTEEICASQALLSGADTTLHATFLLPEDAAPSFKASDNEVTWRLLLKIQASGYAEVSREVVLRVVP